MVAVTGIDGCGKSSVIRRFAELWPDARGRALALTCPTYHETPNTPFARLSERLHRFSRTSDALGSFELKGAAIYLQMTLHGPVERCLLENYRPAFLLTEHHSLVDTLAYGAIYTTMIRRHADAALEAPLRAEARFGVARQLRRNRAAGPRFTPSRRDARVAARARVRRRHAR